jgi:hypothetical protein
METKEKLERITELMMRRDKLVAEFSSIHAQMEAVEEEGQQIDKELVELVGGSAQTITNGRTMTCSKCGQTGHNKRKCPN